jgi:ATP-dependent DNA ligase
VTPDPVRVTMPFGPPIPPMLAQSEEDIPRGDGWSYEPKWDGFRAIVFRDGDGLDVRSRNDKPLNRYFPELLPALAQALPDTCVVDGEIVIATDGLLDFDALLQRIHPAESRVRMLAEATPSHFVAFDLLAEGDEDLRERSTLERRSRLEKAVGAAPDPLDQDALLAPGPRLTTTPYTSDPDVAAEWMTTFEGRGLDGVIAKRDDLPYRPGERVMVKIKNRRTADCVVGGYRMAKRGEAVGSLLLGLYGEDGLLHHVGFTSSFRAKQAREVLEVVREHEGGPGFTGHGPGGPSRWRAKDESEYVPLHHTLVCEVSFDHVTGIRFRHGTRFHRWRPDKPARECTIDQLRPPPLP